jgi:hypothetical protein
MQLNESTYETIFLLYIDNELSPKERLEVETFIADNPSYALEMEALKATLLHPENVQYAFKENLKQHADETSLEELKANWEENWEEDLKANYTSILKEDIQKIPGLSTSFKNALKKETISEGILIKPFNFNQNKFTYAAIAACLMVFIGYQQLTKTSVSNSSAANSIVSNSLENNSNKVLVPNVSPITTKESTGSSTTIISNSNKQEVVNNIKSITKTKKETLILEKLNTSELEIAKTNKNVSIAIAEPTRNNSILNNQAIITKLPSSYNNTMTIDALVTETSSVDKNTALITDEKATTSYELIDTEDPNRTIFIANFEIDGAAFRGITRRVSALLKRNKSEKEKDK